MDAIECFIFKIYTEWIVSSFGVLEIVWRKFLYRHMTIRDGNALNIWKFIQMEKVEQPRFWHLNYTRFTE